MASCATSATTTARWWTAFALLLVGAGAPCGASTEPATVTFPIVFTQEPLSAPDAGGRPGTVPQRTSREGSRIVTLAPDGTLAVLTPDFAAACDPCVSFDGERVLFAGRRLADEPWNIFEIRSDGSGPRQITTDLGDCMEPLYLARASVNPPQFEDRVGWVSFTSTAAGVLDEYGKVPAASLYVMSLETVEGRGTVLWRTTYNLGGEMSPTVLQDGRVLFSSRRRGSLALMTITWAGDNINPFYGSDVGPVVKVDASELPDRTVAFVESDREVGEPGGRLVRVSLRRPLASHEVLSRDDGRYRNPHPLPDGGLAVSWAAAQGSFGIYRFDLEAGRPGAVLFDDPEWNDVDAQAVAARPEPVARIPMLEFASVLDIPGFHGAGQLHCLNVYDSDVPEVADLEPGIVRWVRFVEGVPMTVPAHDDRGSAAPVLVAAGDELPGQWPPPGVTTRLLGEAPVEADGSFFVNIVGDTPFFMQILDRDRRPLYTMRAWTWVRSGSQRGCIGCHENKELTPVNRATQALIKMRPTFITTPPEERPVIDLSQ